MKSISLKKGGLVAISIIVIISAIVAIWYVVYEKVHEPVNKMSGVEKNYGVSHMSSKVNINGDGKVDSSVFQADDIVPDKDTLIQNLKDKGFEVREDNTLWDSAIQGEHVYATSGKVFCRITYGLKQNEADQVFPLYEKEYTEDQYYIMAKNGSYVYCISDHDTFTKAGFNGLDNVGIQYINYDNY